MGVNDAQEMLEAAQDECIRLERENAELVRRAERAETLNQITQDELRQAGAVRAELATRTTQRDDLFDLADKHLTERDAALAVIEQVRDVLPISTEGNVRWSSIKPYMEKALAQSPASVLAKVKADAWDEGYTVGNRHDGRRDANPYRKTGEQSNG